MGNMDARHTAAFSNNPAASIGNQTPSPIENQIREHQFNNSHAGNQGQSNTVQQKQQHTGRNANLSTKINQNTNQISSLSQQPDLKSSGANMLSPISDSESQIQSTFFTQKNKNSSHLSPISEYNHNPSKISKISDSSQSVSSNDRRMDEHVNISSVFFMLYFFLFWLYFQVFWPRYLEMLLLTARNSRALICSSLYIL